MTIDTSFRRMVGKPQYREMSPDTWTEWIPCPRAHQHGGFFHGVVTLARNAYYRSSHWKALREAALRLAGHRCAVPGCNGATGLTVDHIKTRPNSDHPTPLDNLANVRVLCGVCDRKVKELPGGERRNGGIIPGADLRGFPVDPNHIWWRS
jgi:hypothetical protein